MMPLQLLLPFLQAAKTEPGSPKRSSNCWIVLFPRPGMRPRAIQSISEFFGMKNFTVITATAEQRKNYGQRPNIQHGAYKALRPMFVCTRCVSVSHKNAQFIDSGRVLQLFDSLRLDLANTLTGDRKTFPHFLKGMITTHINAIPHAHNLCFTR